MTTQGRIPYEKTGWYLVLLAVAMEIAWIAAIVFVPHSGFMFGLVRGLGLAPVASAAGGANVIVAARKARKAAQSTKAAASDS